MNLTDIKSNGCTTYNLLEEGSAMTAETSPSPFKSIYFILMAEFSIIIMYIPLM